MHSPLRRTHCGWETLLAECACVAVAHIHIPRQKPVWPTLFLQNPSLIKHSIVKSNNTTIITYLAVCNPQEKANSYKRSSSRNHPLILKLPVSDNNAVTEKTNPKR